MKMEISSSGWSEEILTVVLISIRKIADRPYLYFYFNGDYHTVLLRNPEVLGTGLLTGTEIKINLFTPASEKHGLQEAELMLNKEDFLPKRFLTMLDSQPPSFRTFFGLISAPENNTGRYYMLRDHNADGLLLCTGKYIIKKKTGVCENFDGEWTLRYDIIENFFYGIDRPDSDIAKWKHSAIRLIKIDDTITIKNLNKKFRNYAAGWHRYNFFCSDDWSLRFYRKQARLGFISITHCEEGRVRLTPQLQREYAVLDWKNMVIDRKIRRILSSNRIEEEKISLQISPDPSEAIAHLREVWSETWMTDEYERLIKELAGECRRKKDRRFRIWGITLTAGERPGVIAGELGYSIGTTYTSLSGFFHRGDRRYNNFGKLQMVMLAKVLQKAGISFWNLGQPYMEYKIRLGAEVVPRGLFLKRWDKAVRGRTPDLQKFSADHR